VSLLAGKCSARRFVNPARWAGDDVGGILHDVARCFGEDDVQVEMRRHVRSKHAVDHDGDVLCRRIHVLELRHIEVEILVVELVEHMVFDLR
jgi:hypothetical protein